MLHDRFLLHAYTKALVIDWVYNSDVVTKQEYSLEEFENDEDPFKQDVGKVIEGNTAANDDPDILIKPHGIGSTDLGQEGTSSSDATVSLDMSNLHVPRTALIIAHT